MRLWSVPFLWLLLPLFAGCDASLLGRAPIRCEAPTVPFAPSNVGDRVAMDGSSSDVVVASGEVWLVSTEDGSIQVFASLEDVGGEPLRNVRSAGTGGEAGIEYREIPQDGAVASLAVFAVGRLEVQQDGIVIGRGPRPMIWLASTRIDVAGTVSVDARAAPGLDGPGPGGFAGSVVVEGDGEGPGHGLSNAQGGAGGGAFGGPGGDGAPTLSSGVVGAGGMPYGNAALVPLLGGSGGASAAGNSVGAGGDGGGAVQLAARQAIHIALGGVISACGGGGGRNSPASAHGGGGGGAGGAILLEAPSVILDGVIGANGGAGETGSTVDLHTPGDPGRPDLAPVEGPGPLLSLGPGGDGSDAMGIGGSPEVDGSHVGGGGGGGGGRIRINTLSGEEAFSTGVLPTVASELSSVGVLASPGDGLCE